MSYELKLLRFEQIVHIDETMVSTFEIEDKAVFARVIQSLIAGAGPDSKEPYQLWRDGEKIASRKGLLILNSLPELPINDRSMISALHDRMSRCLGDRVEESDSLNRLAFEIETTVSEFALELWGSYSFEKQWETSLFLKAFGFLPEYSHDSSLLENCISFFGLCVDTGFDKALVMVNPKSFFSEIDFQELINQAISCGICLLTVESCHSAIEYDFERKTRIDRDFVEL